VCTYSLYFMAERQQTCLLMAVAISACLSRMDTLRGICFYKHWPEMRRALQEVIQCAFMFSLSCLYFLKPMQIYADT
jgi:hypothetical protein